MKFSIINEHRDFYQKNKRIEFEGLILPEQLFEVNRRIEILSVPQKVPRPKSFLPSPKDLFLREHDLWRQDDYLKKIIKQPKLAEIASQLIEHSPLRLGYDQLLRGMSSANYKGDQEDAYVQWISKVSSLEETCFIEGVRCGLILCLKGTSSQEDSFFFPKVPGNGVYFSPQASIDLPILNIRPDAQYLLIVYVQNLASYLYNERNPHTHDLKKYGYIYGDRLKDKFHPIVWR